MPMFSRARRALRVAARAVFLVVTGAALLPASGLAMPETVTIDPVDFDQWAYPFNFTPGVRATSPTFGAFDEVDFDQRDGQFVIAVDTDAAGIPTGGGFNYSIHSVVVRATHFTGGFEYDPTYDVWQTYLDPMDPSYIADSDTGRPLELYGLGFRNGFTFISFAPVTPDPGMSANPGPPDYEEDESFGPGLGMEQRNVFPLDFDTPNLEDDVSNNVMSGFDPMRVGPSGPSLGPWAVGLSTSGLAPGDPVPQGAFVPGAPPTVSPGETFEFTLDVSDWRIQEYVREGLDDGTLAFVITSLTTTAEMTGGTNPNYFNKEGFGGAVPASVEIIYLPEPGAPTLLASGIAGLLLLGRRRARA